MPAIWPIISRVKRRFRDLLNRNGYDAFGLERWQIADSLLVLRYIHTNSIAPRDLQTDRSTMDKTRTHRQRFCRRFAQKPVRPYS